MPSVEFAPALQRHVECPRQQVEAATLRAALDAAFADCAALRGYVLDDQSALRKHIAIFVDGEQLRDRSNLNVPLAPTAEVYVVQALSGG